MKRTILLGAIAGLIGLGLSTPAVADVQRGQATLAWLTISANARDAAMGNTAVFTDENASAAFQNPAGLGRIERSNVYFQRTAWLADMSVSDLAAAYRVPNIGTFALSIRSMNYGDFDFTEIAANPEGYNDLTSAGDVAGLAIGVAYGRSLTDKFAIGGQIKWASDQLGKMEIIDNRGNITPNSASKVSGMLFDFGTNYNTGWKSLNLSMAIQNFGSQKGASNGKSEYIAPLIFKVGMAADVLDFVGMEDTPAGFIVRVEGADPRDNYEKLNLGGELRYDIGEGLNAAVRGGYSRQTDGGLSFGLGVGALVGPTNVGVDYSYSSYGSILGAVNRLALSVSF